MSGVWPEVDTYKQLERDYELKLAEYNRAEVEYRVASEQNSADPALVARYQQLNSMRQDVEGLRHRLSKSREDLASMRDKSMGFEA